MAKATLKKRVPASSVPDLRNQRRAPVSTGEILGRLNELLEAERAGVEAARSLATSGARGFTVGELKKFGEDEGWACGDLRKAILRFGGTPSERTGDFARRLLALPTEGERVKLLARGQAWVVKRIDVLLGMGLDPETKAFLVEMREQHLENIDACNRRADELAAPPSVPYQGLPFAHLREAHDHLFYGVWRGPSMTVRDLQRAYHELGRYLDKLSSEVGRSRSREAKAYLDKAMEVYGQVDPGAYAEGALVQVDNALSYGHKALNALLRHYRVPVHDPGDFLSWYDRNVPIHDDMYIGSG